MLRLSHIGVLICALALSACQMTLPKFDKAPAQASEAADKPRGQRMSFLPKGLGASKTTGKNTVLFAASNVRVAAPQGYCTDTSSLEDTVSSGFALLANCKALKGRRLKPDTPELAVLTASISSPVGAGTQFDGAAFDRFFTSKAGRAALARSGDANHVHVIDHFTKGNVFYIHARDVSSHPHDALSTEYWRAITLINARLVTLTVTPFQDYPLPNKTLRAQVTDFAQDTLRANGDLSETIVSQ